MGGVLELTGYPIRPLRLIAMVTVLWLTSIPALFMIFGRTHAPNTQLRRVRNMASP